LLFPLTVFKLSFCTILLPWIFHGIIGLEQSN
jgi:hypothetical protein